MNGREIIKKIMELQGITNTILATKLNITQAALWDRLDTQPRKNKPRKDIPVSLLSEMINVMNYKVVVVPKNTIISNEWFVVDENKILVEEQAKPESSKFIKLTPVNNSIDNKSSIENLDDLLK